MNAIVGNAILLILVEASQKMMEGSLDTSIRDNNDELLFIYEN